MYILLIITIISDIHYVHYIQCTSMHTIMYMYTHRQGSCKWKLSCAAVEFVRWFFIHLETFGCICKCIWILPHRFYYIWLFFGISSREVSADKRSSIMVFQGNSKTKFEFSDMKLLESLSYLCPFLKCPLDLYESGFYNIYSIVACTILHIHWSACNMLYLLLFPIVHLCQ